MYYLIRLRERKCLHTKRRAAILFARIREYYRFIRYLFGPRSTIFVSVRLNSGVRPVVFGANFAPNPRLCIVTLWSRSGRTTAVGAVFSKRRVIIEGRTPSRRRTFVENRTFPADRPVSQALDVRTKPCAGDRNYAGYFLKRPKRLKSRRTIKKKKNAFLIFRSEVSSIVFTN